MNSKIFYIFLLLVPIVFLTSSCGSSRRAKAEQISIREVSFRLGIPITKKNNMKLYSECASWIGAPYRYGGINRRGTDCSGLVYNIYKDVYGTNLSRSTSDILKKDCKKIRKGNLKEGDLVFFNTGGKNKKTPTHVGIYLKDGKFIHASSSKGVMVNSLSEPYYARNWLTGGRVK